MTVVSRTGGNMAGQWRPGDSVPDRYLLALEAGSVSLEETCAALGAHQWPDSTPAIASGSSSADPFPEGGWVKTVEAAYADGRVTQEQYEAIWLASSGRGR
jgi:hypothetical protein